MATTRTFEQKMGDWKRAYDMIRDEIVPYKLREILDTMKEVEGIEKFQSYVSLTRTVLAGDRAAATVAAMLTTNGIKTLQIDGSEEI